MFIFVDSPSLEFRFRLLFAFVCALMMFFVGVYLDVGCDLKCTLNHFGFILRSSGGQFKDNSDHLGGMWWAFVF